MSDGASTAGMLATLIGPKPADQRKTLLDILYVHPLLAAENGPAASRAVIALALNLLLLAELIERTPTAAAYVADTAESGGTLVFDHGALRTVDLPGMGMLPAGREAIARVLEPLGYAQSAIYPLDALRMTGYSYTHRDFPEDLPQFFVSELHVDRFSAAFGAAMARVTASSRDPLAHIDHARLDRLDADGKLPLEDARALLPRLAARFACCHSYPALADYEILLAESAEAAWIATEGNVFNHAANRVDDLDALVAEQRARGRPMKERIEISSSGRVRQTAYKADPVERWFIDGDGTPVLRQVPGSFFEFIERGYLPGSTDDERRLDLGFDSGNAQGIFKMTAV